MLLTACYLERYGQSSDIKRSVWNTSSSDIPDHTTQDCKLCKTHMVSTLNIKSIIVL